MLGWILARLQRAISEANQGSQLDFNARCRLGHRARSLTNTMPDAKMLGWGWGCCHRACREASARRSDVAASTAREVTGEQVSL